MDFLRLCTHSSRTETSSECWSEIRNCSLDFNDGGESLHNGLGVAINKWCAKAVPYMEHLKKKEKYYMERLHDFLERTCMLHCQN